MYQNSIVLFLFSVLTYTVADESLIPTHIQEHNEVRYPTDGEQYLHPNAAFGQVPHPPPPPQFFFQQHPPEQHQLDVNHDIHTNLIDHGDPNMAKIHREEERRLFDEVMQNKFEMNSMHSELAEMHHELQAFANGKAFPSSISHDVKITDEDKTGGKSTIKTKLEGPPIKKIEEIKKDGEKSPIKKLLDESKDSLLSPFLNSLSEALGGKGVGHHLVGLGSLVPIILVKIAAKLALITFSSKGLKALATLIPTIALLLINGIVLFLIWYQNFKARLGEHEFGDLFGHLFGNLFGSDGTL